MKRLLIVLLPLILLGCGNKKKETLDIIPKPVNIQVSGQQTYMVERFVIESQQEKLAEYLAAEVRKITGIQCSVNSPKSGEGGNIVIFSLQSKKTERPQGRYTLDIKKGRIEINGDSKQGIFYGIQSALQIIYHSLHKKKLRLPLVHIEDYPRFNWRGMHLDVSRHFFDKEFIKKYIDILALHKMNVFHWHLTDDQGWRIQIDAYPRLTEVGAWRKGTGKEEWNYEIEAAVQGQPRYGGYYTKDDVREIVAYAKERFITIVPEIELPGHSWSALYAYPNLSCSGKPWKKPADVAFEFSDPFCAGNEETFEFFEKVFAEIIELFPSEYIHLGGDEAKKTPWEKCPKCQRRMREEGLQNVDQLQTYFVNRVAEYIESKGRKVIGWDEIAHDNPKTNLAIMVWRDPKEAVKAVQKGHPVVFATSSRLYFNTAQYDNEYENIGPKMKIDLKDTYSYEPIQKEIKKIDNAEILGVEGCLWTEFVYTEKQAQEQLLPRLAALAELAWTPQKQRDWNDFYRRIGSHYAYLTQNKIDYFISPPLGLEDNLFTDDRYSIELSVPVTGAEIYYTLDGTQPGPSSLLYTKPIVITEGTHIKAVTILPNGERSKVISADYKKTELRPALDIKPEKQGLKTAYYLGSITTLNDFDQLQKKDEYISSTITLKEGLSEDDFGLEFNGYIKIPADGVYTFYLSSDDGSRLFIDGQLAVDYDGLHGMGEKTGKIALQKGFHKIRVIFFEGKYGQGLKVSIAGLQVIKRSISKDMLYYE